MKIVDQDITKVKGYAVICHQVNCMRVMGSGLALQIRNKWPHVYQEYKRKLDWKLGDCQLVKVSGIDAACIDDEPPQFVANLAGQHTFGGTNETNIHALERALRVARDFANANNMTLFIPYMIGCGLGGGDWEEIGRMIDRVAPDAVICRLQST